jgi:hypothetical protein
MKRVPILCTALLSAVVVAQDKVDLRLQAAQKPLRYTIESTTKGVTERAITVDGEAMEGRGPTGPTNSARTQTVVFDEGRADNGIWRLYVTAKATTERPDDTGGVAKQEIEGSLAGQRLFLIEDDRGVVARVGSADGEELPRGMGRGLPGATNFAGITPSEPVAVGGEFELSAGFLASLRNLNHPVTPAMNAGGRGGENAPQGGRRRPGAEGAEGGEAGAGGRRRPGGAEQGQPEGGEGRQPRGQGGQGGQGGQRERGQGGQPGQGAPGGGRFGGGAFGGAMGGGTNVLGLLANEKLEGKLIAKLVGVENGVAKLTLAGKRAAEGGIDELGLAGMMMGGGRMGRGGQGGGQGGGAPAIDGDAAAELEVAGELWIDVASHQLVKLVLEGKSKLHMNSEMDRNGQVMGIESKSDDSFRYAVAVQPAPEQAEAKK